MKSYLNSIFDFPNSSDLTKKVLVIDEIDVFFDERFYGKLYCPSINITNENIQNLIKLIW